MKGVKTILDDKAQAWIIKHFKHTKNAEIAERYGISETYLHRFAREHGLTKTKQFQRKCQAETSAAAALSHRIHGTYPPKGYIIPGSERHRFRKGESSRERLGEKGEAERIRKSAESRRKTWKLEHARKTFGLPQETRLRVFKQPKAWVSQRYSLKKHGYVVERGSLEAYWTADTRRSARLERRPFRFAELNETPIN